MKITVTQSDIEAGKPNRSCQCPIARAVSRSLGYAFEHERVVVNPNKILLLDNIGIIHTRHNVPSEVTDFVTAFDSGEPVAPFSFHLDLP